MSLAVHNENKQQPQQQQQQRKKITPTILKLYDSISCLYGDKGERLEENNQKSLSSSWVVE